MYIKKTQIYQIENTKNGKVYVGSTTVGRHRWSLHLQSMRNRTFRKKGTNAHLYSDFGLYGEESFVYSVLEEFDNSVTNEFLRMKELEWIEKLNAFEGYNKINPLTGKVIVKFEQNINNNSKVPVLAINRENEVVGRFEGVREAAEYLGLSVSKVSDVVYRDKLPSASKRMSWKGYVFVKEIEYSSEKDYWEHLNKKSNTQPKNCGM